MKRFVICLAITFGGALWFHVMALMFGFENALVYGIMEVAAGLVLLEYDLSRKERGRQDCDWPGLV